MDFKKKYDPVNYDLNDEAVCIMYHDLTYTFVRNLWDSLNDVSDGELNKSIVDFYKSCNSYPNGLTLCFIVQLVLTAVMEITNKYIDNQTTMDWFHPVISRMSLTLLNDVIKKVTGEASSTVEN